MQFFVTLIIAIAATAVGLQATEEVISLMFVCMAAISWLLAIIFAPFFLRFFLAVFLSIQLLKSTPENPPSQLNKSW